MSAIGGTAWPRRTPDETRMLRGVMNTLLYTAT